MSLKNKKVLITGGLGFIGSNVAVRCLEAGAEVTVYDCLDPRSGGNMYNLHGVEDSVRVVVNDIRSLEGISSCIRGQDILFHCAAYTSHPDSMKDPLGDIDVNCKGTINILESARRFNPEIKFVHVGTSTQNGKMCYSPVDEKHPEFPMDIYSANKTVSEKYVLIYGGAHKMRTTVVRLANVFGPRSNIKIADLGFMNYFIGLALQGKPLTVYGKGAQLRNITYVEDCVEALIAAALSPASDHEVFFAVGDKQYSVTEIAGAIAENVGGEVKFVDWPGERAAIEIGDAVISNAKIKKALGWSPLVPMAEGLVKTKEYFVPLLKKYL